jgi:predicted ribosomally synthesized peptide with nif11-like leader
MLNKNARDLVERLRTDKSLRDRIAALDTLERRIDLLRSMGYRCDPSQIKEAWDSYG